MPCVYRSTRSRRRAQPGQQRLIVEGEQLNVELEPAVQVPAAQSATDDMFEEAFVLEAVKQDLVQQGVEMELGEEVGSLCMQDGQGVVMQGPALANTPFCTPLVGVAAEPRPAWRGLLHRR